MVKVITIHGTNAGIDSTSGEQWWHKNSAFQERLNAHFFEPVEFVPYQWSGKNSERDRREAGKRLAELLLTEGDSPIIIGHSHGGSVAIHAIFYLFLKSPTKAINALRVLITVGTPMIRYRSAFNPMFRFNIIGQLLFVYCFLIMALLAGGQLAPDIINTSDFFGRSIIASPQPIDGALKGSSFLQNLTSPKVIFGITTLIGLTLLTFRSSRRNRAFANNQLYEIFKSAYVPLNHREDEAIAGLKSGVNLKIKIADRRTICYALFPPLALLLAVLFTARTSSELLQREASQKLNAIIVTESNTESYVSPVSIRDVSRDFRDLLSGGRLRTLSQTSGFNIRLLTKAGYLTKDYLVMDLGTAQKATSKEELVDYLTSLKPDGIGTSFEVAPNEWRIVTLYLTPSARNRMVEELKLFHYTDDIQENTLIERFIASGGLLPLAESALLSSIKLKQNVGPVERKLPPLKRGDSLEFDRSLYNNMQARCLLASLNRYLMPLTGTEPPIFSGALGFCVQFEGGKDSLFYDVPTTILGNVEGTFEAIGRTFLGLFAQSSDTLTGAPAGGFGEESLSIGFFKPLYFIASIILVAFILAWALSFVVAPLLGAIFNKLIQKNIFGNDGHGETVTQVASGINFAEKQIGTLPTKVESDISAYAQTYAPETIARVRALVSLTATKQNSVLPLIELSECITWRELIHTSYFDVDSFIKLVAEKFADKTELTLR